MDSNILPERMKTIKIDVKTWVSLKNIKKESETFNDIIKDLLNQRTKSFGNENVKAIKYHRKTLLFTMAIGETVGVEIEYNDIAGQTADFVLELKIKKIFFKRKVLNSSQFFGTDNEHKHYSQFFLSIYFEAITKILLRELRIYYGPMEHFNLSHWRKLYSDYSLSEESFKEDIEEPLRLSVDDIPSKEWKKKVEGSVANAFVKEAGINFK